MLELETEVLVIGGGLAGLAAALEAKGAGRQVLLLCKRRPGRSGNSLLAATNISTVLPESGDSPAAFLRDTLDGGRGIGDPELVRVLAEEAGEGIGFLSRCGVEFLEEEGRLQLRQVPGHRHPRTACCAARGLPVQVKGQALTLPLLRAVEGAGVGLLEGAMAVRLLRGRGRVAGVLALDPAGKMIRIRAGAVVLACGGGGRLFADSNNTREMTGDGLALAWEAGAELRDLEFVQFHPAMGLSPLRTILPTTLFGDGALLRNRDGRAFLTDYVPGGEAVAGRDEMSRAIFAEMEAARGVGEGVWLDLSPVPEALARGRYGDLWEQFGRRGCDPSRQPVVVGLAVHFLMGGMVIDRRGASTLPGLFGAGEVTGGVHGANRLGGNALLEAVVFGRIAGRSAAADCRQASPEEGELPTGGKGRVDETGEIGQAVGRLLRERAGVIRSGAGLMEGLATWRELAGRFEACSAGEDPCTWWETRSRLTAGRLILEAALRRTESRGAHFRSDHPAADDRDWLGSLRAVRSGYDGGTDFRFVPVP